MLQQISEHFSLILGLVSTFGYGLFWWLIYNSRLTNSTQKNSRQLALLSILVIGCHGFFLYLLVYKEAGISLGLSNIICLSGVLISSLTIMYSLFRPTINLALLAFPLAALSIILSLIFPSDAQSLTHLGAPVITHILFSLLGFSILSIAAGQAIFIASLDAQLKNKVTQTWRDTLPPLQTLETTLFEIIRLGFTLLSLSILTGFLFLEDIFAQQLAHKSFFTLFSWLVFFVLLLGRWQYQWRGRRAINITLGGYGLLLTAFIGSKFVLEVLLERA